MGPITNDIKIVRIGNAVAAGSSIDNNSDRVDMQDFDGAVFVAGITDSVNTGVATLTIEQNTADSDTGMAALSGAVATLTSASNDDLNAKALIVDIYKPRERYLQAVRTSATANIAYGEVYVILYRGRKSPITQDSDSEVTAVVSPAES